MGAYHEPDLLSYIDTDSVEVLDKTVGLRGLVRAGVNSYPVTMPKVHTDSLTLARSEDRDLDLVDAGRLVNVSLDLSRRSGQVWTTFHSRVSQPLTAPRQSIFPNVGVEQRQFESEAPRGRTLPFELSRKRRHLLEPLN